MSETAVVMGKERSPDSAAFVVPSTQEKLRIAGGSKNKFPKKLMVSRRQTGRLMDAQAQ
jgi:hypothetical protein